MPSASELLANTKIKIDYAKKTLENPPRLKTGVSSLDELLGGGYPKGRITEIFGEESTGKTFLGLLALRETIKEGKLGVYIDTEGTLNPYFFDVLGIDKEKVLHKPAPTAEEALSLLELFTSANDVSLIVLDSVACLLPEREQKNEVGEMVIGLVPRLLASTIKKVTANAGKSDKVLLFINQVRTKIGVQWGNPITTPGGSSLRYACSLRCEVRKGEPIKDKERKETIGRVIKVKVKKSKICNEEGETTFELSFAHGLDKIKELIEEAIETGRLEKKGGGNFFLGEEKWRGYDTFYKAVKESPELQERLLGVIKE